MRIEAFKLQKGGKSDIIKVIVHDVSKQYNSFVWGLKFDSSELLTAATVLSHWAEIKNHISEILEQIIQTGFVNWISRITEKKNSVMNFCERVNCQGELGQMSRFSVIT